MRLLARLSASADWVGGSRAPFVLAFFEVFVGWKLLHQRRNAFPTVGLALLPCSWERSSCLLLAVLDLVFSCPRAPHDKLTALPQLLLPSMPVPSRTTHWHRVTRAPASRLVESLGLRACACGSRPSGCLQTLSFQALSATIIFTGHLLRALPAWCCDRALWSVSRVVCVS